MPNTDVSLYILNLIVASFGAIMMFSMKSETSRESPWTKHLFIALSIFAVQYLAYSVGLRETTFHLFNGSNSRVWSEFFGLPIDFFLFTTARMLLNRQRWLPRWFFALIIIDLVAVILGVIFHLEIDDSPNLFPTLCRVSGDAITFISLLCLGYASFINTRLDKTRAGFVGGAAIGIIYSGIHLLASLSPNIAYWLGRDANYISAQMISVLIFVAALSKLVIVYTAFHITTLEYQTLIKLRRKLQESVDTRKVFFSRRGILDAIIEAFGANAVKLYVRVPPVREPPEARLVHIYSGPSKTPNEYEIRRESDTPIPELSNRLTQEQEETNRRGEAKSGSGLWSGIFQAPRPGKLRTPFGGIEPIRYHGALIGCLKIEKKGKFTYSAETLCRVLSEDISALVQFYRVQESLRILIEGFHKFLETLPQKKPTVLSSTELNRRFEEIIQEVLSPLKTRFRINAGFVDADLPNDASAGEASDYSMERKTVAYDCVTDPTRGSRTIGHIYLDYQKERDPVGKPSLGYFKAYRNAVGSIVTKSFLSCVEQKLNLIIRNLSLELTKKLDFDKLLDQIHLSVREAELVGVVIYHSGIRDLSEFVRKNDTVDNRLVGEALAVAFPNSKQVLEQLEDSPTVVTKTSDHLLLGMKLGFAADIAELGDAGLFVGVRRLDFADELGLNTPWCNFLRDLAHIAGNALQRIIQAKKIQRNQIQQTEDYMILSTAEKVGLITHELLSHIENLANNSALLKLDLPESLDEASRKPIDLRIEEMRKEFAALRSLTGLIRSSAQIPERSGPSSLQETLKSLARLHESRNNIKIELQGVKNLSAGPGSAPLNEVKVKLPRDIVELTFGNLIRNSVAAIKRKANDENKGTDGHTCQGVIKIWVEVEDGEKLIDCFINDNGSGIPAPMMERIFDVNVSSTPGHGGWGLFYVKRKLKSNGGSINLEHSEPGNTTFRVRLPRYQSNP